MIIGKTIENKVSVYEAFTFKPENLCIKNKKEHIICLKILLIGNIILLMRRNHVEPEKLEIEGLNDVYALSVVKKEFKKAVDEPWRDEKPWKRYQKALLQDLAILVAQKEKAIVLNNLSLYRERKICIVYVIQRHKKRACFVYFYRAFRSGIVGCFFGKEYIGLSKCYENCF